jgi:hypothetical protein
MPAAPGKVIPVPDRPVGVTRGWGGKYYVTTGKGERDADGAVKVVDVEAGTVHDFAVELDQPGAIGFTGKLLIVTDGRRVWRIDARGAKSLLVDEDDFPAPPFHLTGLACQPGGKVVHVADPGDPARMRDRAGKLWPPDSAAAQALTGGRVYEIAGTRVTVALDGPAGLPCPARLLVRPGALVIADVFTGTVSLSRGKRLQPLATGLRGATGLAQDAGGTLYVTTAEGGGGGKLWRVRRPTAVPGTPELIAEGLQAPADVFLDRARRQLVVPDSSAGTLSFFAV